MAIASMVDVESDPRQMHSIAGKSEVPRTKTSLIVCMKDEGPFILEWIAYHISIGVTGFAVVTNDCSDGTTELLDRLDAMGIIGHYPNPSQMDKSDRPIQHQGIAYAQLTKEFVQSEWAMVMDADEFLNINIGNGHLNALYDRIGDVDAISFNQLVFGSNGLVKFEDSFVTEQFTHCFRYERPMADNYPLMYGIKTLARNDLELFSRLANHRPVPKKKHRKSVRWLDGSGTPVTGNFVEKLPRCYRATGGTHALGHINHYAVRSLESYIIQSIRGDAVNASKLRDTKYWRQYNRNEIKDLTIVPNIKGARDIYTRLLADDALKRYHDHAVHVHVRRFSQAMKVRGLRKGYEEIQNLSKPPSLASVASENEVTS